jgi:hypothetical protein
MGELTTSIVGITFPNENKSKSNMRMECMCCGSTNPFDANAVAASSERGVQLGRVSAERGRLISRGMK